MWVGVRDELIEADAQLQFYRLDNSNRVVTRWLHDNGGHREEVPIIRQEPARPRLALQDR